MFFLRKPANEGHRARTVDEELLTVVRAEMPAASDDEVRILCAVAGLIGGVAYADGEYSGVEAAMVRAALARVHGLSPGAVDAICAVLAARIRELVHGELQRYARELVDGTEREARVELLEVLMDLAAADETITLAETNHLRRVASLLGLSPDDYLAAQSRHRDKLSVLR